MQSIKCGDRVWMLRDIEFGPTTLRAGWPMRVLRVASDQLIEITTVPDGGIVFGVRPEDISLEQPKQKPPLGLKPQKIWVEERIKEILEAMARYNEAGKAIPREWLEELGEHIAENTTKIKTSSEPLKNIILEIKQICQRNNLLSTCCC